MSSFFQFSILLLVNIPLPALPFMNSCEKGQMDQVKKMIFGRHRTRQTGLADQSYFPAVILYSHVSTGSPSSLAAVKMTLRNSFIIRFFSGNITSFSL